MSHLLRFLFPYRTSGARASWLLLSLRILFGGLLLFHGLAKWSAVGDPQPSFPDPLGLGGRLSLWLALFAEVVCSAAVILGVFYRLALIPMIVTMWVACCVVHGGEPFAARELPFVYWVVFILLFAAGAGDYALDRLIGRRLR